MGEAPETPTSESVVNGETPKSKKKKNKHLEMEVPDTPVSEENDSPFAEGKKKKKKNKNKDAPEEAELVAEEPSIEEATPKKKKKKNKNKDAEEAEVTPELIEDVIST